MARTAEAAALTARHRTVQLAVRAAALRDLQRLWAGVDPLDLGGTVSSFALAGAVLVRARRRDSAAAAARYFRVLRRLEGVAGTTTAVVDVALPVALVESQVRGAALAGVVNARRRGFSPQASAMNGFVKTAGSASSLVLGGGRQVLVESVRGDGAARGWQRVTSGSPCAFCAGIAASPTLGDGADFQAHDHCSCTMEPLF